MIDFYIENCPFEKPKYMRVLLYDYVFTERDQLKETGDYWSRKDAGKYIPFVLKCKSQ